MHSWRLIRTPPLPGGLNMAVDEALLESVTAGDSLPVLRLYRWAPPALSVGYAQKTGNIDFAACRDEGVEVVRRATGGRAVLHDAEVTYAVISSDDNPLFSGSILGDYKVIARILREVLRSLGIAAELSPGRERGGGEGAQGAACFTAPSSYELVFRGCKMTGSAQRRSGGAFLQHGSIPVDFDPERLARLLGKSGTAEAERMAAHIGWVNRWLDNPVTVDDVEERLIETFAREQGIVFHEENLTPEEWERARRKTERR